MSSQGRSVTSGLNNEDTHVNFAYQRRVQTDTTIRAYVAQLLLGITADEMRLVFDQYGEVPVIRSIAKVLYGRKIDTGDHVIIFKKLH